MTSSLEPISADEKAEAYADAYYTPLEALRRAEKASGLSRAEIAARAGLDPATVSKVLGGSLRNITFKTFFILVRAMDRKSFITTTARKDLHFRKRNFDFSPPTPVQVKVQPLTNSGTLLVRTQDTTTSSLRVRAPS